MQEPSPPVYRGNAPAPYPAPYVYEPPPPPATYHTSPTSALWVGARAGALFPFGSAYTLGYDPYGYYSYGESWSGMASGGPSIEADVGVRFSRRYIVYGFWEHAFMGTGGDPAWRTNTAARLQESPPLPPLAPFGDQTSATTDYVGAGFRWSSNPDRVGFVVDLGLGYRWFQEKWASGASIELKGFGEFRAGVGADVRLNRLLTVSPLFMFSTGEFHDRDVFIPGREKGSISSYTGSHGTVTLSIGGHFDLAAGY